MRDQLLRLKTDLGRTGLLALVLLVAAFAFHAAAVRPLQQKNAALALELAQAKPAPVERTGARLEKFYDVLERPEVATDWLAKLYAISKATGLEMQSATYRTQAPEKGGRVERYEIVLPVEGTYGQLRDFLGRALAEIPVLSLDQLTLKRETRTQGEVQAELRLTLHLVKP
jgi:hypothetical protein